MSKKGLKPIDIAKITELKKTTIHDVLNYYKRNNREIMMNISKPKIINEEKKLEVSKFFERNKGKLVKKKILQNI